MPYSASSMPTSFSASRASSDGIMPSRAWIHTPAELTSMRSSSPRSASMRSISFCAITLRAVLA